MMEKSQRSVDLHGQLSEFMDEHIYPNEARIKKELSTGDRWQPSEIVEGLKTKAREAGLWNLFLPESELGAGLSNYEYAPLCEVMGRSPYAPEVFNCSAPDTGNMEVLSRYGTPEQQKEWLTPLLAGEIRSAFAMTEPDVASSDATNIQSEIRRDGADYVVSGHKWWTSGANDPRCKVRVPASNLLLGEGRGFEIAQGRLGPGRIHHCMRLIGLVERALEAMCRRVKTRVTFGRPIAEQTVTQERIAEARIMIDQNRLLTLYTAHKMDQYGNKEARKEIAMIKVAAPNMACQVIDWAIQAHGGGGVSDDFGLGHAYATARLLRLADGPDEVHRNQIARLELKSH